MAEDTGLETGFVDGAKGSEPEKSLATAVFRVAQEALTNVARHAEARRVVVELRAQDGELLLAVFDDGRGYDHAAARARAIKGASMGILGMEERVALAGGRLQVVRGTGRGTRVEQRFRSAGREGERGVTSVVLVDDHTLVRAGCARPSRRYPA